MSKEIQRQIKDIRRSMFILEAALAAYAKPAQKPYVFQAGDVTKSDFGVRIFFESRTGEIRIIDSNGLEMVGIRDEQGWAEEIGYVKIGVLSDYLPKDK